ncbi:hypothetical protein STBA_10720 [Streptomyces sp. MP131-18]|nr:hypothetical protein STBA_10720 [Streptomyces sp. MP131-18]
MADIHRLPLLGHDLELPAPERERVKVYKDGPYWTSEHRCPGRPRSAPKYGYPQASWREAFDLALTHVKRCLW